MTFCYIWTIQPFFWTIWLATFYLDYMTFLEFYLDYIYLDYTFIFSFYYIFFHFIIFYFVFGLYDCGCASELLLYTQV